MKSPKVSVIIPVYNAQKTIGGILEKLITQEYKNIEVIAVNDGSKDGSLKIVESYSNKDNRVLLVDQVNGGASAARNSGIAKASGDFIVFIDSDDDINKSLILRLVSSVQGGEDFAVCGMSINGDDIRAAQAYVEGSAAIIRYVLKSLLVKNLLYGPCCKIFKTTLIKSNGIIFPIDIRYGEDTIFVLSYLSKINSMRVIDESLYTYKITSSGLAMSNRSVLEFRRARLKALNRFVGGNPSIRATTMLMLVRFRWSLAYFKSNIMRLVP
ncbi:glycosyltransferase [Candidatus Saccharibacteria bacterium]|nr:glycosyltransferase [Candidatus Saccharibacteria bacterium]MBH1973001.1 glycosyltransferase [Candidatus Saccharibacteria bacterium]MBH1991204.1 glycosyltransferase [Candidatus Saccharibacteria bacterium]